MGENVSLIDGHDDEVKKSCNDCLHNEICLEQYKGLNQEMMFRECKRFKAKEDLVEVKHGKYIQASKTAQIGLKCSLCGARIKYSEYFNGNHHYCYKCGAKMDGERRGK